MILEEDFIQTETVIETDNRTIVTGKTIYDEVFVFSYRFGTVWLGIGETFEDAEYDWFKIYSHLGGHTDCRLEYNTYRELFFKLLEMRNIELIS